jgi:hypothetical protein
MNSTSPTALGMSEQQPCGIELGDHAERIEVVHVALGYPKRMKAVALQATCPSLIPSLLDVEVPTPEPGREICSST